MEPVFIYFIWDFLLDAIKIGHASDPCKRLRTLQIGNVSKLELLATIECRGRAEAQALERQLHERYGELWLRGEWFRFVPPLSTLVHHGDRFAVQVPDVLCRLTKALQELRTD